MSYLKQFSRNLFPNLSYGNPFDYFINPIFGDFHRNDFSIDVAEKNSNYIVKANLPGFNKEDIELAIDHNRLTISANIEQLEQIPNSEKLIQNERYSGAVSRTICLPTPVDEINSVAHLKNGVLEVVLGKKKIENGNRLQIK